MINSCILSIKHHITSHPSLTELLDGLFVILSDPNVEIRRATESVMGEFLKEITEHPDKVDFAAMVNILIQHSQPKQVKFFTGKNLLYASGWCQ